MFGLMRGIAVVALVCAGCSSKDDDKQEQAPAPAPTAAAADAAPKPTGPSPDELACRGAGDAAACARAAAAAPADKADALWELACFHGDATGCAKKAEAATGDAAKAWYGKACRRGDDAACSKADPGAAALLARVSVDEAARGPVADRLRGIYRNTVADCLAEMPEGKRDAWHKGSVKLGVKGGHPVGAEVTAPAPLADCLKAAAPRWRFAGVDQPEPAEVAIAIAKAAADERPRDPTGKLMEETTVSNLEERVPPKKDEPPKKEPPKKEPPPPAPKTSVVKVAKAAVDEQSSLTGGAIQAKVRRYYAHGLERCHQELLKREPTAVREQVPLKIRITDRGRVGRAKAEHNDSLLETCIGKQAMRWRFDVPKDASGKAIDLTVTVPLLFTAR